MEKITYLMQKSRVHGVAVDLSSTGCITGELYVGKPIMPGRTEVLQKLYYYVHKAIRSFLIFLNVSFDP
jgi:hypothetical protein